MLKFQKSNKTPLTPNKFLRLRHKKVECRSEAIASPGFLLLSAEHVAALKDVVREEQIPCESLVIEVYREIAHHALQIIALTDDVAGEILLTIVLALIILFKSRNAVIACGGDIGFKRLQSVILQLEEGYYLVEHFLTHTAL